MTRVNFREVRDRFTHIDAEFVSCTCTFGEGESSFVVRFYPWWEHPLLLQATREGQPWRFAGTLTGVEEKEVTVFPQRPLSFNLSHASDVIDWAFLEEHPLLWEFEDRAHIFCNENVAMKELFKRLEAEKLPFVTRSHLLEHLDPLRPCRAPFALQDLPRPLFLAVRRALDDMGVRVYVEGEPQKRDTPILFLIDDSDYIVAEDFELDVPEFEHKDEWFDPGPASD